MGLSLLTAVFNEEELLSSNVKGGKSKIKKKTTKKQALNADKLKAIKYTVREMFPKTFNDARMNSAVNTKLSILRAEKKLQDKVVPEHESDVESQEEL
ncbi:hypothetical protein KQX54_001311 [Cotesia glomerata]|uniref:BEN domain-containing protein n=1 Tax=Cotesia glomerata TaxID=32391 RepID=A0AAV7J025_COTGL|nr:hypothetical protein KQX54_001311 [Cotesia glomerata]